MKPLLPWGGKLPVGLHIPLHIVTPEVPVAKVLIADPPWLFGDSLPGKTRGASKRYSVLTKRDIERFPLPLLDASGAVLFLWRVAAMQQEALDVAETWGFTPKAELVWNKLTEKGKRFFGMGHYTRGEHETCLICIRGKGMMPDVNNVRSTFTAAVGRHSEKPDEFYRIVRTMYPDRPTVELFARQPRAGVWTYGNDPAIREKSVASCKNAAGTNIGWWAAPVE